MLIVTKHLISDETKWEQPFDGSMTDERDTAAAAAAAAAASSSRGGSGSNCGGREGRRIGDRRIMGDIRRGCCCSGVDEPEVGGTKPGWDAAAGVLGLAKAVDARIGRCRGLDAMGEDVEVAREANDTLGGRQLGAVNEGTGS